MDVSHQSNLNSMEAFSPAVCRAGYFQFSGEQNFFNECIQSRGLFWCRSGRGHFEVNGEHYQIEPHDLYVLPWNRRMAYYPDENNPMHTGHVHVVPHYVCGAKWIPCIPHKSGEAEFNSQDRQDVDWPGFARVYRMKIKAKEPLGLLMDYAIRWFMNTHGEYEAESRCLAHLIVNELFRKRANEKERSEDFPEELERMVIHIEKGFQLSPTVNGLAGLIGRSRSYVLKLFKEFIGISPKRFIIDCQLHEARELLLSTTLSIAEVGQAVGIADPYHFSKLFRRHIGVSPSEYRKLRAPVSVDYKASTKHQPFLPLRTR